MKFSGMNKIKAFFLNLKLLHIDIEGITAPGKIDNLYFFMPVMRHTGPAFFFTDLI